MQATTGSADFTGVFVKWQHQPGQKYIQLMFKTAAGMRMSVSRNRHLVRSLTVGRSYRIKGRELSIGGTAYVHEPTAIPLPVSARRGRKAIFIISAMILLAIAGAGLALTANRSHTQSNAVDTQKSAIKTKPAASATLAASKAAVASQTPAAAAQPPAAAPAPATTKVTPKKAAAAAVPAAAAPQPGPAASPAPAAAPEQNSPAAGTIENTSPDAGGGSAENQSDGATDNSSSTKTEIPPDL